MRKILLFLFFAISFAGLTACQNEKEFKLELSEGIKILLPEEADLNKIKDGELVKVKIDVPKDKVIEKFTVNDVDKKDEVKDFVYSFKIKENTKLILETESSYSLKKINIAPLTGTLPNTIFALNYLDNTDSGIKKEDADKKSIKTYIWLDRNKTFNFDKLPEHMFKFPNMDESLYQGTENYKDAIDKVDEQIKKLISQYPNIKINLYINDYNLYLYYKLIVANSVSDYNVFLMSDGNHSFSSFKNLFNNSNPKETLTKASEELTKLKQKVALEKAYTHTYIELNDHKYDTNCFSYVLSKVDPKVKWALKYYTLKETVKTNVSPEYKGFMSEVIEENKNTNNIIDKDMGKYLKNIALDESKLNKLKELYNLNGVFDGKILPTDKVMTILGTRHYIESEQNIEAYIKSLKKMFPEFKLIYKGHPAEASGSVQERVELLKKLNLEELDSSIPAELLFYLNSDMVGSGYGSTTFNNITDEQSCLLFNSNNTFNQEYRSKIEYFSKYYKGIDKYNFVTLDPNKEYVIFECNSDKTFEHGYDFFIYDVLLDTIKGYKSGE